MQLQKISMSEKVLLMLQRGPPLLITLPLLVMRQLLVANLPQSDKITHLIMIQFSQAPFN